MAFSPQSYRPDPLASGGATQKPFVESSTPHGAPPGVLSSLLRLAMRRLPAHGFAATQQTKGIKPASNAMTMGSHGKIK